MDGADLVLEHVSKIFGPRPEQALERLQAGTSRLELQKSGAIVGVHDVSLEIAAGQIFVIMGLSGSGKSTLLRLLNRLVKPTAGHIFIKGTDLARLKRKELVRFRRKTFAGMVFQGFAILPHRTTLGNVAFGLELQGVPKGERLERARSVLALVGLDDWEEAYPHTLSGGMQQRVGLARALALEGSILLMDEPFSALDPLIRRELQEELLGLQARLGKTVVFVTHDLNEALKLGDRIAILKEGRVQHVASAQEIVTNPADPYIAAFVAGVDRAAVLTASSVMTPVRGMGQEQGLPHSVKLNAPLHEVIRAAARSSAALAVVDNEGQLVGTIEQGAILSALAVRSETLMVENGL